jgi:acetolactate synthase-1/2/3 large subunit
MTDPRNRPRTGADLLCETLLAQGVDHCFANPGTSEMHFVAALDRQPAMRCVLGLAEGVVTGAADGYARMADKPACTLMHTGPGLANGLANLHNAKRAHTPMVNIVGDHATYHLAHDAPLTSDIEALARPMSHWVARSPSAAGLGEAAAEAVRRARMAPGCISTLILPADHAWSETDAPAVRPAASLRSAQSAQSVQSAQLAESAQTHAEAPDVATLAQVAAALQRHGAACTLLLAGRTLRDEGLELAAAIAARTGVKLLAPQANARVERGLGRVMIDRVPYVVDKALALLAPVRCLVLVGAKAPVGFFAYPGKPSSMLPPACEVLTATRPEQDGLATLRELAARVGASATSSASSTSSGLSTVSATVASMRAERRDLPLPTGPLTAAAVAQSVVAQLPEHAIVCDESVSSGRDFFPMSYYAAPHDYLQITGGAIGIGPPLATGAALGAPGRKVVALQADGSAAYTLQALWTQARERLDVLTVIFANRRYAILHGEYAQVGAGAPGANARRLFDLEDPALDWVALACGMGVAGERVTTAEQFNTVLAAALLQRQPFLIEAVI